MQCNYVQRGEAIDYVNTGTAAIPAGSVVVMGNIAGIAMPEIKPGQLGSLAVEGVFDMPCGSASFAAGDRVDWDATGSVVVAAADGIALGWVIEATTGNQFVRVKLTQ